MTVHTVSDGGRRQRWRIVGWSLAGGLLLVPLIAMQFTSDVAWTLGDFLFFGALIGMIGAGYEVLARRGGGLYQLGAAVALAAAFLMIWSNAAVGIIGDEGNPANAMFAGVLLVAVIGAIVARLRAAGMARAMIATAAAQLAVAAIAIVGRLGADSPLWPRDIVVITAFFTALWLIAAALFAKAARG
ncbi:MAG: hypothetical protein ACTHM8_08605 [Sphingomonas sp.]